MSNDPSPTPSVTSLVPISSTALPSVTSVTPGALSFSTTAVIAAFISGISCVLLILVPIIIVLACKARKKTANLKGADGGEKSNVFEFGVNTAYGQGGGNLSLGYNAAYGEGEGEAIYEELDDIVEYEELPDTTATNPVLDGVTTLHDYETPVTTATIISSNDTALNVSNNEEWDTLAIDSAMSVKEEYLPNPTTPSDSTDEHEYI